MKTRTLIGTALLLSTAGLGVALAATQAEHQDHGVHVRHQEPEGSAADGPLRFAGDDREHGDRARGDGHHDRSHHADDEDDDDDDNDTGDRRGAVQQTGPADPAAPVPDNGLFQGKARPKVEVQ